MKSIVAAIDFSPMSELVVAQAVTLAQSLAGKVILVTVMVEPVYLPEYAPPPKRTAKLTVAHERTLKQRLVEIQTRLRAEAVPAEVVLCRGAAAQQVLALAEETGAAFIVIGSHGHGAVFELFLGSTSQAVVKRARCPVLVIPPRMRKPRASKQRWLAAGTKA